MTPEPEYTAHSLRQLHGQKITPEQLAEYPLMPDRTAGTIAEALKDDYDTHMQIGPFRRKLDKFDAMLNPRIPDSGCEYCLVLYQNGLLIVAPLKPDLPNG